MPLAGPIANAAAAVAVAFMAVALAVLVRARRGGPWSALAWGGAFWAGTVACKVALAILVLAPLARAAPPGWVMSLATGALTGLTEVLLAAGLLRVVPVVERSYSGGLMFGLGFGVVEALLLACLLLLRVAVAFVAPMVLEPPDAEMARQAVESPLAALVFVHERLVSIPVHTLAGVWIVLAVTKLRWRPLLAALLLKSVIDAIPGEGLSEFTLQLTYFAVGVVCLVLLLRLDRGQRAEFAAGGPSHVANNPP